MVYDMARSVAYILDYLEYANAVALPVDVKNILTQGRAAAIHRCPIARPSAKVTGRGGIPQLRIECGIGLLHRGQIIVQREWAKSNNPGIRCPS